MATRDLNYIEERVLATRERRFHYRVMVDNMHLLTEQEQERICHKVLEILEPRGKAIREMMRAASGEWSGAKGAAE